MGERVPAEVFPPGEFIREELEAALREGRARISERRVFNARLESHANT